MQEVVVEVQERNNPGKNESRRMRKQGLVPAVVYGGNKEPRSIAVDPKLLLKIFHSESGANTIFQLNLQGTDQRRHVMIKEYQVDPVKGALLHVDLVRIQMDEAIEVMVPIRIVGDAVGVKVDGGILDHVNREIRIESLPANIPEHIDIDVRPLKIGDTRRVSDIPQSDRFKIMSDPEQILVVISAPTKDEADTPVVDEAEVVATAEPEVIKKGKAASEGEEGKEENDEGGKK